jgi:hypothetical protein
MSDLQLKALEELFEQSHSLREHKKDAILQTINTTAGPKVTYDVIQNWWYGKQARRYGKQARRCKLRKRKAAGRAESTHKRQRKSP